MNITIERRYNCACYSIGRLYIDGVRFCDTLEDTDRGLSDDMDEAEIRRRKVYGETAIPTGTYHCELAVSPKFRSRVWAATYGGRTPRLLSVKGYEGVLIHPGNSAEDTFGCILVGENKVKGQVINSTATYLRLMDKLTQVKCGITVTVVRTYPPSMA